MSGFVRIPPARLVRLVVLLFLPLALVAGGVLLTLPERMNAIALQSARDRGQGLADVTARLVAPALEFEAHEEAAQSLERLAVERDILSAVLYDEHGEVFARVPQSGSFGQAPPMPERTRMNMRDDFIEIIAPVRAAGGTHGILAVRLGLADLANRRAANMTAAGLAAAVVALVGLVFSILTALFLIRRQTAEEALRRAAESFGALADSLPVALVIHRNDRILYVNPSGRQLLSGGGAIPVGTPLSQVFRPDRPLPEPSRAGGVEEYTLSLQGGATLAVEAAAVPVQFHDAGAVAIVAMDVTERKRLLERLVLTDRLASLGTMAAGVAHEINNPLTVVLSNAELLRFQIEEWSQSSKRDVSELIEELDSVRDAAQRVGRIVKDLRSLTRSEDSVGPVDLELALDKALQLVGNQIHPLAQVVKQFAGVPRVSGNEGRIVQVFINLLINAAQALPDRKREENRIEVSTSINDDGCVVATVSDNGEGIPPEIADRIFDPFFTTKSVGVGTGLGLSIVHNLIRDMGGEIELSTSPGVGTAFSIVLVPALGVPAVDSEPAPEVMPRRARLLVIDDEPMVCKVLERMLGANHEIVTSTSPVTALSQLERGERFDLILCDLRMPEMSGTELARQLAADNPDQRSRLFFMTGDQGQSLSEGELGPVLGKPFTRQELVSFLDARMGGAA